MRLATICMASAGLAACAASAPPPGMPVEACSNTNLNQFVGQPATQELGARMLATSGARILRWVAVGQMITMDFSPERLTVRLTRTNQIESATCG